ncbi:MAG: hypothetical protein WEC37_00875 [Anaerolineales bacterium]
MLPPDEKGKIFTEVVRTEGVKVVIQTKRNKIRGVLHKPHDQRMIDKLSKADKFLPVTQVVVYDQIGKEELHRTDFLAINCDEIIWLFEEGPADIKPKGTDKK